MLVGQMEVSSISFEDSCFFRQSALFEVFPVYFFEDPSFSQVRPKHGVFVRILDRNEFIQKSEEFFYLLFWIIGVILCILDFEGVHFKFFSGYNVWQRVKAWIADWNAHGVISILL